MNKAVLFLLGCILFFLSSSGTSQNLVINEFMSSNAKTLADEDGDFEDWIELFNSGSTTIHLHNYGLSDNPESPFRWRFPNISIAPGQFMLVWASGKNRNDISHPLHTNFSISSQGEPLLLTSPQGQTIDQVNATALLPDISYGRKPDGSNEWGFFMQSTPGTSNTTPSFEGILEPPLMSHPSGFYTQSFQLQITHPDPIVQILYTLDGSEPHPANLAGKTYAYKNAYPMNPGDPFGEFLQSSIITFAHSGESMLVADRSAEPDSMTLKASSFHLPPYYFPNDPVYKGTVIRARAVKPGYISSVTYTSVYFIDPLGRNRISLPVIHLSTNASHFFDYYDGIYNPGIDFDTWRQNNPEAPVSGGRPANYRRRGDQWEYPAHLAFFDTYSPDVSLSQDIGFRIHGGWSRAYPMKTLRIYARGEYGHSSLEYPFFPDQHYNAYKRILLRNSGNDWSFTLFRDALIQTAIRHMNFETLAYRPSVLFVNGEYWGIHNIRERYDTHYLNRVFGVNTNEIDLLEGNSLVKEGSNAHYLETLDYIQNNDITQDAHYNYILTRIDPDNFIDYQIANIYAANSDWPGNNIDFWRKQTNTYQPNSPYGHDGRWRWLAFDMDFGFGYLHGTPSSNHNTLAYATQAGNTEWPNPDWSTFLLRNLLLNETFRNDFINRFADHINTTFRPDRINALITQFQQTLLPEMPEHIHRWKQPQGMGTWNYNVDYMRNFVNKRPERQRGHILTYFNLADTVSVNLDVADTSMGYIRINSLDILPQTPGVDQEPYPWSGVYFAGVPVTIRAIEKPGFRFSHWEGTDYTSALITSDPAQLSYLRAHFVEKHPDEEPDPEYRKLIHYWHFGTSIPNDQPLENIEPGYSLADGAMLQFHSALEGYPFTSSSPFWRKASMERRNAPTPINYRAEGNNNLPYNETAMRGIQIKQPFYGDAGGNTLIFHLPLQGFEDPIFRFAARDEFAANHILVDYTTTSQMVWTQEGLANPVLNLSKEYQLFSLDFTGIANLKNNPSFKIRLRFGCDDPLADDGHRVTFNNFSVEGNETPVGISIENAPVALWKVYPNPARTGELIILDRTTDLTIFDISGRQVLALSQVNHIDTSHLKAGSYIVKCSTSGQRAVIMVLP